MTSRFGNPVMTDEGTLAPGSKSVRLGSCFLPQRLRRNQGVHGVSQRNMKIHTLSFQGSLQHHFMDISSVVSGMYGKCQCFQGLCSSSSFQSSIGFQDSWVRILSLVPCDTPIACQKAASPCPVFHGILQLYICFHQ